MTKTDRIKTLIGKKHDIWAQNALIETKVNAHLSFVKLNIMDTVDVWVIFQCWNIFELMLEWRIFTIWFQ